MLKKLRSIFIVEEETQGASHSGASVPATASETSGRQPHIEMEPAMTVQIKDGEVNEKFLNILLEAIEKNNLQGFDYIEYKQFLKSLDKVELDEATRFRSAFATGQTMGATKENLISSAARYLDILKQEEARFEDAAQSQRSKLVDEKLEGINKLESAITEKDELIAKLASEIEAARKEIAQRKEDVALAQARVQQTQVDFQHTYAVLIAQMKEDIEKINTYLS